MQLCQVVYGKPTKRITLQRALVSKLMFEPERCTYKEVVVLFDNLLWLQLKAEKDPDFKNKFGITLKVLAYLLKRMDFNVIQAEDIEKLSEKFRSNLKHFGLAQRNFKQPLIQQWRYVDVRPSKPLGKEVKTLPPSRYIGIGYRDKGTAKKPWIDGSPSWQEVAMRTKEDKLNAQE